MKFYTLVEKKTGEKYIHFVEGDKVYDIPFTGTNAEFTEAAKQNNLSQYSDNIVFLNQHSAS